MFKLKIGVIATAISWISMMIEGFSWLKEVIMLVGIALATVGLIIAGMAAWPAIIVAAVSAAILTIYKEE